MVGGIDFVSPRLVLDRTKQNIILLMMISHVGLFWFMYTKTHIVEIQATTTLSY